MDKLQELQQSREDNSVKQKPKVKTRTHKEPAAKPEGCFLTLGRNTYFQEKNRFLNTLVLGKKNSGKSSNLLTSFAKQDLERKDCGLTFIVSRKDVAYTLVAMARKAGRKKGDIIILKPSANFKIANEMLSQEEYSYETVNTYIDYKEAIKKKKVVIIDMEYSKYREFALGATARLLMQLQIDMQNTKATLKRNHFVYVDDAYSYLPFIELLLTTGESYNIGTMLFMQSRSEVNINEANKEVYMNMLDNNVRNLILTNSINTADAEFYRKQFINKKTIHTKDVNWELSFKIATQNPNFVDVQPIENGFVIYSYYGMNTLLSRKAGNIIYETIDNSNLRDTGMCQIFTPQESYLQEVQKLAIKIRKQLHNETLKQTPVLSSIEQNEYSQLVRAPQSHSYHESVGVKSTIFDKKEELIEDLIADTQSLSGLDRKEIPKVEKLISPEIVEKKVVKNEEVSDEVPVVEVKKKKKGRPSLRYQPLEDDVSVTEPTASESTGLISKTQTVNPTIEVPSEIQEDTNIKIEEKGIIQEIEPIIAKEIEPIVAEEIEVPIIEDIAPGFEEFNAENDEPNFMGDELLETMIDGTLENDADLEGFEEMNLSDDLGDDLLEESFNDKPLVDGGILADMNVNELLESMSFDDDIEELDVSTKSTPIKNEEEEFFPQIQRPSRKVDVNPFDEDDFVIELTSNKSNEDRLGMIVNSRPKRKAVVLPQATRSVNERYLNNQLDSLFKK